MNIIEQSKIDAAAKFWVEACGRLGVDIIAPYILKDGASTLEYLAFIPSYGGLHGTLICPMDLPKIRPNENLRDKARLRGFFISSINISPYAEGKAKDKLIQEILEDWGYYGELVKRPVWLNK